MANLLGGLPKLSQKWLLYDQEDPKEPRLYPEGLDNLNPLQAGQELLNLAHQKLASLLPNYPPLDPK